MHGSKLLDLLHLTRESPVFGDAYPLEIALGGPSIQRQIATMHSLVVARLVPILSEWMHPIGASQVDTIIRELGPKSTAFCSAIAAGELDDVERLAQTGLSIALVYWIDHCMDRGDLAMEQAVRWFASRDVLTTAPEDATVRTRLVGLRALERCIRSFARPEDADVLVHNVLHEVLMREVRVRELSRLYEGRDEQSFWQEHAREAAEHAIWNGALVYVTAAVYAVHRTHQPRLPALAEVFEAPDVMRFMNGPAAAMIRVVDDLGDHVIDSGADPRWGQFTLNIFNQPHFAWLQAFLDVAGLQDEHTARTILDAFSVNDQQCRVYIFQAFVDFVREQFAALPASTYAAYRLFLDLGRRVIEAGYVNSIGDTALAEG